MTANNHDLPAASGSNNSMTPKTPADPYPPAPAQAMRQFLKDLQPCIGRPSSPGGLLGAAQPLRGRP